MTQPNHREAQLGHDRSHYAWTPEEAAQFFADYREEILAVFEGHYAPKWMAPGETFTVCVDDMRRLIAKLRGAPPAEETP